VRVGAWGAVGRLSAGSLSPDNNGRSAAWWLYQGVSAGPRVWTCEIDGSSSFSVSRGRTGERDVEALWLGGLGRWGRR
jgi:hypothetical protein